MTSSDDPWLIGSGHDFHFVDTVLKNTAIMNPTEVHDPVSE